MTLLPFLLLSFNFAIEKNPHNILYLQRPSCLISVAQKPPAERFVRDQRSAYLMRMIASMEKEHNHHSHFSCDTFRIVFKYFFIILGGKLSTLIPDTGSIR